MTSLQRTGAAQLATPTYGCRSARGAYSEAVVTGTIGSSTCWDYQTAFCRHRGLLAAGEQDRLRSSRVEDVVEYLSGRGNFMTSPFTVSRFVLLSSRDSVGGGPYLTEEVFPLHEVRSPSLTSNDEHPASSIW